jgi:hypothetical protein
LPEFFLIGAAEAAYLETHLSVVKAFGLYSSVKLWYPKLLVYRVQTTFPPSLVRG